MRLVHAVFLSMLTGVAFAQAQGDGARGNTPPGLSQDGSRPAEGAITGGSIAPGESAGIPEKNPATGTSDQRWKRCDELSGSLREDCLRKERSAAGGASPKRNDTDSDPNKIR
jgi:hypothetical protein